jgi:hypothetical protein
MNAIRRSGWALALPLMVAAVPVVAVSEAHAAGSCYPRDAIIRHLAERYGERPVATGVAQGHLVLLLSRADGASWTILLVPSGSRGADRACPLAAGEAWHTLTAPPSEGPALPESSS